MFYGREDLLEQLGDLLKKRTASLVTCRGCRRIGKSTLVEEFARRNRLKFMKLEGLSPRESDTNAKQLAAFCRQLGAMTGRQEKCAANWFDAFAEGDDRRPYEIVRANRRADEVPPAFDTFSYLPAGIRPFDGLLRAFTVRH